MNFTLANQKRSISSVPSWLQARMTARFVQTWSRVHQMNPDRTFTRNHIREDKTPLGVTKECLSGHVWNTPYGDSRDAVLDQGQTLTVDGHQRTLVVAFDAAAVRCTAPVLV